MSNDEKITVEIRFLVDGHVMSHHLPDDSSTIFTSKYLNDDGTWEHLFEWIHQAYTSDYIQADDGCFINRKDVTCIWAVVNGVEHGRPAWLPAASDMTD